MTATVETKVTQIELTVEVDTSPQNPEQYSDWKLVTFSDKHLSLITDEARDYYFPENDETGESMLPIGLRRQLACGTAFVARQMRDDSWEIDPSADWEGCWGLLLYTGRYKNIRKYSVAERTEHAAAYLSLYSEWGNGNVYQFNYESTDGKYEDALADMYGDDYLVEYIRDECFAHIPGPIEVTISGDMAWLFKPTFYSGSRANLGAHVTIVDSFTEEDEDEDA